MAVFYKLWQLCGVVHKNQFSVSDGSRTVGRLSFTRLDRKQRRWIRDVNSIVIYDTMYAGNVKMYIRKRTKFLGDSGAILRAIHCIRVSVNVPQNHAPIQSKMADGTAAKSEMIRPQ